MNNFKYLLIIVLISLVLLFLFLSFFSVRDFFNSVSDSGFIFSLKEFIDMKVLGVTIISLTALLITILNYLRKYGFEIEATFGIKRQNINDKLEFEIELILFNNKDRPVFITEAYIKLPDNIYISMGVNNEMCKEISDVFILKPYEIKKIKTEPDSKFLIQLTELIGIEDLITDNKNNCEIIIATTHGEIKCKKLKDLMPRVVRALYDNSYVIQNGIFSQELEKLDISKWRKNF